MNTVHFSYCRDFWSRYMFTMLLKTKTNQKKKKKHRAWKNYLNTKQVSSLFLLVCSTFIFYFYGWHMENQTGKS